MAGRESYSFKKGRQFTYPILAAQKFIRSFEHIKRPNEDQSATLAAAYFTLASQTDISCNKSKMHINSAITLLKNIGLPHRKEDWSSQIAHAYFKRAELLEEKQSFILAASDYQKAIEALEKCQNNAVLDEQDRLLISQSAISIADLIVNEQLDDTTENLQHPLYYVNQALEHLSHIETLDDELWSTHAYAHQIAGIALSQHNFEEAKEAFRVALFMAFKTNHIRIGSLLADIYTCLGLLYEQNYYHCPIMHADESLLDHAMIYFGLSLVFNPSDAEDMEEDVLILESLFEMIYRVIDPYLPPVSHRICCDVTDALIYAYLCVLDNDLPNKVLETQLKDSENLDLYAQHVYWLVRESHSKQFPRNDLNEILEFPKLDFSVEPSEFFNSLESAIPNNVHYLDLESNRKNISD